MPAKGWGQWLCSCWGQGQRCVTWVSPAMEHLHVAQGHPMNRGTLLGLSKLPGTVSSPWTHLGAGHTLLLRIFSGDFSVSLTVKHFYSTLITGFIFSPLWLQQQLPSCSAKLWSAGSMTRTAHCCDWRQIPQVFYKLFSLLLH